METIFNGWFLRGFDVVTLWCHNLNYKKWMEDIARTIGKKVDDVYILLCDLKVVVGSQRSHRDLLPIHKTNIWYPVSNLPCNIYIRQSWPLRKSGHTIIPRHVGVVLRSRLVWLLSYPPIGGAIEHRPTRRCSRVTSLICLLPPHHTVFFIVFNVNLSYRQGPQLVWDNECLVQ